LKRALRVSAPDFLPYRANLGLLEHPAPNVGPSDVIVLVDGREALVTARVDTDGGPLAALLEVVAAPGD